MRPSPRALHRLLSLLMVLLLTSGCSSWSALEGPPARLIESSNRQNDVRLVMENGKKLVIRDAAVAGDSVVGYQPGLRGPTDDETWRRVAIPTSEIHGVERSEFNLAKTLILIAAAWGAFAGAALILCATEGGCGPSF